MAVATRLQITIVIKALTAQAVTIVSQTLHHQTAQAIQVAIVMTAAVAIQMAEALAAMAEALAAMAEALAAMAEAATKITRRISSNQQHFFVVEKYLVERAPSIFLLYYKFYDTQ